MDRSSRRRLACAACALLPSTAAATPWQVAIVDTSAPNALDGRFCGGTLIAADRVLTAAHCAEGASAADLAVVANRTPPSPRS